MPRNAEVIRQWTILREIEKARGSGVTIDELAALCTVTTRTIRRDLQALEESGFPLYDDRSHDDGKTRWQVNGQAFKGLSAGLTVSELCALYFSRTLLESLSGTPFRDDLETAFDKLSAVLTPHMRQFLDQLPRVPVESEFEAAVADYVCAREWHPSQRVRDGASGGVLLSLDVCLDRALHSWILSFGPFARVVSPPGLAREIAEQFAEATARYAS